MATLGRTKWLQSTQGRCGVALFSLATLLTALLAWDESQFKPASTRPGAVREWELWARAHGKTDPSRTACLAGRTLASTAIAPRAAEEEDFFWVEPKAGTQASLHVEPRSGGNDPGRRAPASASPACLESG